MESTYLIHMYVFPKYMQSTFLTQICSGGCVSSLWNFNLVILILNSLSQWGQEAQPSWMPRFIAQWHLSILAATSFHLLHIELVGHGVWYWSFNHTKISYFNFKISYFNFNPFSLKEQKWYPEVFSNYFKWLIHPFFFNILDWTMVQEIKSFLKELEKALLKGVFYQ